MLRPLLSACAVALALIVSPLSARPAEARYAAIVVDADTGRVLHEHDADTRKYPASLTKMMTLYLVFEALEKGRLKPGQMLPVSAHAAGQSPSKLGLVPGERISTMDAALALITKSANDAAVVLAEAIGRNEFEFARMMTAKARQLGMSQTTFQNANGLPHARQMSTARDMATLARALQRDHAKYYPLFATTSFTWKGTVHANHNHLLGSYEGADGIKTGFIRASGFNLVASAKRDGRRLIGVVFGGESGRSRDAQMVRLLDRGFEKVKGQKLLVAEAREPRPEAKLPSFALIRPAAAAEPEQAEIGSTDREVEAPAARRAGQGWTVQVGAFSAESAARKAISDARGATPALAGAASSIDPLSKAKNPLYRARLTGLSQQDAKRACAVLAQRKAPCMVLPPA